MRWSHRYGIVVWTVRWGGKAYAACAACPDAASRATRLLCLIFVHTGLERRLASKSWPGSGGAGRRKDLPCSIKAALHQVRSKSAAGAGLLFLCTWGGKEMWPLARPRPSAASRGKGLPYSIAHKPREEFCQQNWPGPGGASRGKGNCLYPTASRYLLRASCQGGRGRKPLAVSFDLSMRLFMGRFAFAGYWSLATGVTFT